MLQKLYGNVILRGELCLLHFTMFRFLHVYQNVEHQFATASAHKLKHAVCTKWQYFGGQNPMVKTSTFTVKSWAELPKVVRIPRMYVNSEMAFLQKIWLTRLVEIENKTASAGRGQCTVQRERITHICLSRETCWVLQSRPGWDLFLSLLTYFLFSQTWNICLEQIVWSYQMPFWLTSPLFDLVWVSPVCCTQNLGSTKCFSTFTFHVGKTTRPTHLNRLISDFLWRTFWK